MTRLRLSPQWHIETRESELYIGGGQDALFTLELLAATSFFAHLAHGQEFTADELEPPDRILLEQLLSAEVIVPVLKARSKKPQLFFYGDEAVVAEFSRSTYYRQVEVPSRADLLVFVRTQQTLRQFLESYDYLNITSPHILVDLAYSRTLSFGPVVFPGTSACLACLEGRLKTRWGDDPPPPAPRAATLLLGLAQQWLEVELRKLFDDQDYSLVNKTVVINEGTRSMDVHKLLTVPVCPYCQKSALLAEGRLEYTLS